MKKILVFMCLLYPLLSFADAPIWEYFLVPQGTIKEFALPVNKKLQAMGIKMEGKHIQTYYEVTENQFGEIKIKIREKAIMNGTVLGAPVYILYKLDPDVNKVLKTESASEEYISGNNVIPAMQLFRDYSFPEEILSLPLGVGKKWRYSIRTPDVKKAMLQKINIQLPEFEKYEREVIRKKKLEVPAGTYDVFVIKISHLNSPKLEGKPIYMPRYEYYAKDIGLIAEGHYENNVWTWDKRLVSISRGKKSELKSKQMREEQTP